MARMARMASAAAVAGLCLLIPLGALAQSDASTDDGVVMPELEGLAWFRSHDLTGPEMQATLPEDELADWATLLDGTGATFEDLRYTYQAAFDPAELPTRGGLATVRVAGTETATLRQVVADDIALQVTRLGHEAPALTKMTIADKAVILVDMPADSGIDDAVVYATGDTAWALLMPESLVEPTLEQLP